jgi:multiple sugar transport system permease protein
MSLHHIDSARPPGSRRESGLGPDQAPRIRGRDGNRWTPYLFVAPYLVLFTVFVLVPAGFGVWISLHDWDFMFADQPFVGLRNYERLFDPSSVTGAYFWQSMAATAKFTLYSVPPLLIIPLLVALLLHQRFRGRTVFRAIFFAPYILGVAVVGILWRFLADPNIGLINYLLAQVGLDRTIPWTTGLPWGWILLVLMTVWWTLGFNTVIYLAGLQEIPAELYEAAAIDGAGRWQQFRHVTLPGLRQVLFFVGIITVLASANMFGQSYLVTQGAPGNQTRTAIMYIAEEGLGAFRMGNAAAMSYLLAFSLIVVSLTLWTVSRKWRADR